MTYPLTWEGDFQEQMDDLALEEALRFDALRNLDQEPPS